MPASARKNELRFGQNPSRRHFLKTAAAAGLGTLALGRAVHASGSDAIRIGLVGCGGRGPGAAVNAMNVDPGVRLAAMTDIFADRVHGQRSVLKQAKPEQVVVDDAHCFSGLDGYRHVIESVDVVLIACAAKYHPTYVRAAIEAGKHVFVEKPHAIDPVGVHALAAACALAQQKGLSLVSGLQSRFSPGYQETVLSIQETWLRGPYRLVARDPKLNEVEFQFSNQYHFSWLSGDDVTQTLTHNLDRATWVMREQLPVRAYGLGGRSASFGEVFGNVFDHHTVVYEYANGTKLYAMCRTQNGCHEDNSSTYVGTKGRCNLTQCRIEGETKWRYHGPNENPYDLEHKALFSAVRSGKPINCGAYMVPSTQVAVMGQLACYSGKELTWEQVSKSEFGFAPKVEDVRLDMEPPVKPDEKGWYSVPMPGITSFQI
jgi:predicted dehydrogenase